ncbi:argininosuccinate lyase [Kitasatospora sp. NBC_01266]|uniref:argininosuccinate lyase n=1 Tax=Kitasatospora sp. NBC_01266 TaxID=2903572 RepID=UPI002E377E64|nr:lyase family protein [Kitasatospora sp. NBC_01266]
MARVDNSGASEDATTALTGRIAGGPSELLREEVLDPQFRYEAEHLLPGYVSIEKVFAAEYLRMGLITQAEAGQLAAALDTVTAGTIAEWQAGSMSDIAFCLERHVERQLGEPVVRWHVDRSRNDLQACAQLLFGRRQLVLVAQEALAFGAAAHRLAGTATEMPMPGYTHFQAAQIITPGFYFAALSEQVLHSVRRMLATYEGIDASPLGAGAMAGQELHWDRDRMAHLLGFARPQPLALTSVASRAWSAEATAELSLLGAALSRFSTDLLMWSSSEYGFVDLPDELSGISSAMPQKKNFPILERIRGRTAHLTAYHLDVILGQRNTPFTNLVEVSKEAGRHVLTAFTDSRSVLRLFRTVLDALVLRADRMAAACEREYFGGFSLANSLALEELVPWRKAQVIAGGYIVAAARTGEAPSAVDPELLGRIAAEHGYRLADPGRLLAAAFDVGQALGRMVSTGSTGPSAVREVLAAQAEEYARLTTRWSRYEELGSARSAELDRLLTVGSTS